MQARNISKAETLPPAVYTIALQGDDDLPIAVCDTLDDVARWLGCNRSTLHRNKQSSNRYTFKQYEITRVKL